MPHEIITLQLGNYSNYVAAHFWNIQQSRFGTEYEPATGDINNDVLFREGMHQNRQAYTPRMILYDLKDNINVFRTPNSIRETENQDISDICTWSGGETQIFKEDTYKTSDYVTDLQKTEIKKLKAETERKDFSHINLMSNDEAYEMESQVHYWPDYLKVKYHEKSYNTINQYQTTDPDADPFDLYHYGLSLSKSAQFMDTYEDKLRFYAEECDHIQGFQLMVDSFNGFGGLASSCMDLISEEYRKKSVFAVLPFPYFENQKKANKMTRLINTTFTLKHLMQDNNDVMVLPLSLLDSFLTSDKHHSIRLPNIDYQPQLSYHTSAILASLLDSVTSPWRLLGQQAFMSDFFHMFDSSKYKVTSLQSVFPVKIDTGKYLMNFLQDNDVCNKASWFTPLCGNYAKSSELDSNERLTGSFSVCLNGIEDTKVKNPKDTFVFRDVVPARVVLDKYFADMYPKSRSNCFSTPTKLSTKLPFPDIIKDPSKSKKRVINSELLTILQMNKSITPMLDSICTSLKTCDVNQYPKFFENGMEYDDFKELQNFSNDLRESFD